MTIDGIKDDPIPATDDAVPWDVSTTAVVFLGAGFSRAVSNGQMPLMADFFDRLNRAKHRKLHGFLGDFFDSPAAANVESALTYLDGLRDSPLSGKSATIRKWSRHATAVRRELGAYALDRLSSADVEHDNWATQVLAQAGDETTVITTNYDNLAERILSARDGLTHHHEGSTCPHCRMCQLLLDGCECGPRTRRTTPTWRGSLIKLHGSVAWQTCVNDECMQVHCLVPDAHCRPFADPSCACCGSRCSPVLVLPTKGKSYDDFPEIKRMWDAAYDALSDAESLLVFGFSFPACDTLIAQMTRETALGHKTLRRVGVIDVRPEGVIERILDCLPDASSVEFEAFRVPEDGTIPDWLVSAEATAQSN